MTRVLLVEDEPHIIESLSFLLSRAGYDVDHVDNGAVAFETISANPPDVLVLDAMLPGMNGFDLLRRIRAQESLAELPVLMLTAKGQKKDREVANAIGADMFMIKPFNNSELIDAVGQLAR